MRVRVRQRRAAPQVDGPSHFLGDSDVPTGATLLKRRQLRAFGWPLLSVAYFDFVPTGMYEPLNLVEQLSALVTRALPRLDPTASFLRPLSPAASLSCDLTPAASPLRPHSFLRPQGSRATALPATPPTALLLPCHSSRGRPIELPLTLSAATWKAYRVLQLDPARGLPSPDALREVRASPRSTETVSTPNALPKRLPKRLPTRPGLLYVRIDAHGLQSWCRLGRHTSAQ